MQLTSTRGVVFYVDDNFPVELREGWYHDTDGYLVRMIDGKMVRLHRLVLGVTDPAIMVDHRDGDILNNRTNNLRKATPAQNSRNRGMHKTNRTGFKGVSYDASSNTRNRYRAQICVDNKRIKLGRFPTAEEAYAAYCEAATRLHGEFANLGANHATHAA